jgi:serine phosphatase RsbU (regulator of sigma subunit)
MSRFRYADALELTRELENLQDIASYLKPAPGDVPEVQGFEIHGVTIPCNGILGGDHMIYVDFKKRHDLEARIALARSGGRLDVAENLALCRARAGIVLIDVSGHRATDAMLAAMLHQAFLLGATYELDAYGEITRHLFENLNTRFYSSSGIHKFITLIYGEIAEDARFRFISAAHPAPLVFSRLNDRFMEVGREHYAACPPLGTMPSRSTIDRGATGSLLGFKDDYHLNEWRLMGSGDILILYTDGLVEHARAGEHYFPRRLERAVRELKDVSAREMVEAIREDLLDFSRPADDISFIAIRRSS